MVSRFRQPLSGSRGFPSTRCNPLSTDAVPGASCPTRPRVSRNSPRRRSSTSLASSSRSFAHAGVFPLDVVCTRDIARRLLPNLPRCSLRALAGYFGRAVGALRRSADHVEATAFVWQELVRLLETKGVSTWGALHGWLAAPVKPIRRRRRVWPMPRDVRLSLPDAPGIYRMLRTDGSVLYVGKAASLH